MEQQEYAQRGYLREDFRLFHLKGAMEEQLDWHYHTFHKLIFFLGGQSGYGVEGRSYPLEPASRSPRPASASSCARRKSGRRCAARSSRWRVPPCSRASGRSCWQSPF